MLTDTNIDTKLVVFIDLETSGLSPSCEILEIGAVFMNVTFRKYIIPKKAIDPRASKVNGLTYDGDQLRYKGVTVQAIDCRKALEDFFQFLRVLSDNSNNKIILAAHNGSRFDFKHLFRVAILERFSKTDWAFVDGCLDTYDLIKTLHKNLPSYKQECLVNHFLKNKYEAHSALHDAFILQKLMIRLISDDSDIEMIVKFIKHPSCFS